MAAFLRQQLVFHMHGGGARILECANHVHYVQRLAIARIAIHQQRQPRRPRDLANEEGHLIDRDHPDVRDAHGSGHRRAGQIERIEPGSLCLQSRLAVMRARHLQYPRLGQQRAEPLPGGGGGQIGGEQIGHGRTLRILMVTE